MPTTSYRADQLKRLADSTYAAQYLNVAWQETLSDGNMQAFRLALKNVVIASTTEPEASSKIQVADQPIQHLLSEEDPTLETMITALKAVDLTINFKPISS